MEAVDPSPSARLPTTATVYNLARISERNAITSSLYIKRIWLVARGCQRALPDAEVKERAFGMCLVYGLQLRPDEAVHECDMRVDT